MRAGHALPELSVWTMLDACFTMCLNMPLQLPFADFLLTHRGYLQDHQMNVPRHYISTIGLLLADRTSGPFHLDIRYIKAIETFTKTAPI